MKQPPKMITNEKIFNVIPKKTLRKILDGYNFHLLHSIHGFSHWTRVLENGLTIASMNGANEKVIIAFSFFHDVCRVREDDDPGHGARGAFLMEELRKEINLTDEEFNLAYEACHGHTNVIHNEKLDVATCWDADRLDLLRVGLYPDAKYLNTEIGKTPAFIVNCNQKSINEITPDWAEELWEEIYD